MRYVSKSVFLNSIICPTLGWLTRKGLLDKKEEELSLGERFRIDQGIEIAKRSRKLYPSGLLIDNKDIESASEKTKNFIKDTKPSIIFEGTFVIDGLATKADILKINGNSYQMIEVKSSANDKKEFIDDMAYTSMVIDLCGIKLSTISLLLISKDFRLGMENEKLFIEIDHTAEVLNQVEIFKSVWREIEEITRVSERPEPKLRYECRSCPLFKECLGKGVENHIFEIPRLRQPKFDKLIELGINSIENIPKHFNLTANQVKVRNSVQTKNIFIGPQLKNNLSSISWPAYYLDFETVMTAIPLYPDIPPYTQLPIQYSAHKCSSPGQITDHFEYLANPRKDCRRELIEKLINDLSGEGSIIVYGNFEKTIIEKLVNLLPDLDIYLNQILNRIVNFESIISKNFYHPDFHGSTSIKSTLPVLVPDMSYDELAIQEGDSAMAAFAYLALGKYKDDEIKTIKRNLFEYCNQDTISMVKLHEKILEYV